ncbi:hypothetical protein BCV71DRAFT_281191, partial [Rhizopus microsporus]
WLTICITLYEFDYLHRDKRPPPSPSHFKDSYNGYLLPPSILVYYALALTSSSLQVFFTFDPIKAFLDTNLLFWSASGRIYILLLSCAQLRFRLL